MISKINAYKNLLEKLKETTPNDWFYAFNICDKSLCFSLPEVFEFADIKSDNVYGEIKNFLQEHHEEIMERVINKTKANINARIVTLEQKMEEVKKLTKAL